MAHRKKIPEDGYLGLLHGSTKIEIKKTAKKKFIVPAGTKIISILLFDYKDPSRNVYSVEAIIPKGKKLK